MPNYSKEKQIELIKEDPMNLKHIDNQYEDVCLMAVKKKGDALEFVKEKTKQICLAAVRKKGEALEFVENQTDEICWEAIKKRPRAIKYVKNQTSDMCMFAVKKEGRVIRKIKERTPELCFYALLSDDSLMQYQYIHSGIEECMRKNSINIENETFILKYDANKNYEGYRYDIRSLIFLKDYLLSRTVNSKFVLYDYHDVNIMKTIALTNNELILVDTNQLTDLKRGLANRIIAKEELKNTI